MAAQRPSQLFQNISAKIASIPMILTALVVFVGGTIWTVVYSFTNSKLLPRLDFVVFRVFGPLLRLVSVKQSVVLRRPCR